MSERVVIVCGYGCNLDSPLQRYLDRVLLFCKEQRPEHVILCGGATQQKSFPGLTEAQLMYKYLRGGPYFVLGWHPNWFVKDDGYTAYDNIRNAADVVGDLLLDGPKITIFCEATRALKVADLARHFLGFPPDYGAPDIRIETDSWERRHPGKELRDTIRTHLAIRLPFLNWFERRRRIAKAKKA